MGKGRMTSRSLKAAPTRRSTVKKPYGNSRYGNDAFVKIENTEPLATLTSSANQVFSTMRVTPGPASTPGNVYLPN